MNFKKFFKNLFEKKRDLRELCIEEYGEEFGEIYDGMCSGIPVGNFEETLICLQMIEKIKKERKWK